MSDREARDGCGSGWHIGVSRRSSQFDPTRDLSLRFNRHNGEISTGYGKLIDARRKAREYATVARERASTYRLLL